MGIPCGFYPTPQDRSIEIDSVLQRGEKRGSKEDAEDYGEDGNDVEQRIGSSSNRNGSSPRGWKLVFEMIGCLRLAPSEAMQLTLKQLIYMHDGYVLDTWDHTSYLAHYIQNLLTFTIKMNDIKKQNKGLKYLSPSDIHPFRKSRKRGRITQANFESLKVLVDVAEANKE